MKLLFISWRLLRYRVAVMLILFMLFGVVLHDGLAVLSTWRLLLAMFVLALSYVSATSVNDLADQKIDAINHAKSPGRPLISGYATRRDVWLVFGVASAVAVLLAGLLNPRASLVMLASVAINVAYSLPPLRVSYRTFLAPLFLGLGYVCIPYLLGVTATQQAVQAADFGWMAGLYILFIGRIILKDFRDRAGDAKYGKPTFLLRFGKAATCILSAALIVCGGTVLAYVTREFDWLGMVIAVYVTAILCMLVRLYRVPPGKDEQVSIGVGAKMGNGLLITILAAYVLKTTGADGTALVAVTLLVGALFFANFFMFLKNPSAAVLGYKG